MKKIYRNLRIFTMDENNTYYKSGYIEVEKGKIKALGNMEDLSTEEKEKCEIYDGKGKIVIPGMITTHAHFYGEFARGMAISQPICNWQQVLSRMWWKFDKKLTEEQIYYSAMMGLIEGLKYGTTTYFDHQASPFFTEGSLDVIEQAVRQAGARACLSYEVSDRDGHDHRKSGITENVRFIKKVNNEDDGLVRALFGLHAGYTLDQETLEICADYGKKLNCGFHIHVAESMADVSESYRLYDMHVVDRLAQAGILGEKTIAAHGVNVGEEQWKLFKETGTTVAHNIQSNMNNAVGLCPVVQMLNDGVAVALGGDGYTYDLFTELGFAVIMQRTRENDPRVFSSEQIRKFAFENPGKLVKRIFHAEAGVIKEGAIADFLILNYDEPTPIKPSNVFSHMTSAFSGHVETVVVAGKEVVKEGVCTQIDEERILAKCRESAQELWSSLC